ncbi:zinc ABC transporter substrate-binding protein [Coraliomargarita sp. SDUM461004]|uniref:Zinc ABC transporter substrate-binding protein n=1 Tax=Thalassobacterium sedimentorum TaxID=3041258 RepID=A0ABU1ADP8_9BACT|nr:zinc ABC transporter substrate-binding protein [Coraliomargarita sp. SDUM461004]MDQ8192796.1 zinc ABC transporter substrate-binding protein [Coraliomargarita sp. SDUM461004]
MRNQLYTICLLLLVWWLAACAPHEEEETQRLEVWVSLLPQQTIVQAVAGELASVQLMVRPGQSPETYSPSVPQMAALAKADIYFGIGMPLERRILAKMERSMPQLRFVQTADFIQELHHCSEETGHAHQGHSHEELDPHLWMDPQWMLGFVAQVRDAMIVAAPESRELLTINAAALSAELRALDADLSLRFQPYAGRRFYINHPSLGHFAKRYGIVQVSIERSGSEPAAKQIAELVQAAKSDQVHAVFTQPEFGHSSANVLARALDVEVVEIDVLSGDYFSNMLDIAQRLEDSFKK